MAGVQCLARERVIVERWSSLPLATKGISSFREELCPFLLSLARAISQSNPTRKVVLRGA